MVLWTVPQTLATNPRKNKRPHIQQSNTQQWLDEAYPNSMQQHQTLLVLGAPQKPAQKRKRELEPQARFSEQKATNQPWTRPVLPLLPAEVNAADTSSSSTASTTSLSGEEGSEVSSPLATSLLIDFACAARERDFPQQPDSLRVAKCSPTLTGKSATGSMPCETKLAQLEKYSASVIRELALQRAQLVAKKSSSPVATPMTTAFSLPPQLQLLRLQQPQTQEFQQRQKQQIQQLQLQQLLWLQLQFRGGHV